MTEPTLTLGHGYLTDCLSLTESFSGFSDTWTKTEDGNTADMTVNPSDIFDINVTVSAGNKIAYYSYPNEAGANNLNLNSTVYPKAVFRYVTAGATIKAKIELLFNDASTQTILAETTTAKWAWGVADLTSGKTLDHVRLYANAATGHVYYDFLLIHNAVFTFPYVNGELFVDTPQRYVDLEFPSRVGNVTQYLGAESPIIKVSGDMELGSWGTPKGETLHRACVESHMYPWQWFTSDRVNCKVTIPSLPIVDEGLNGKPRYTVNMKHFSYINGDNFTYEEWLGM